MIDASLDREKSVLHVRPSGRLRKEDFDQLAGVVDPFIEETGGLNGLIIETERFPGWEDLGAAVGHFCFVRDHHREIRKVALVTDSPLGSAAENIGSHFVSARIRHFPAGRIEEAKRWVGS